MLKKSIIALGLATAAFAAAPASATFNWGGSSGGYSTSGGNWGGSGGNWGGSSGGHNHYPGCGHSGSSGSSTGGHTTTTTSSSGGTQVPEPGMLGMFGLGLAGIAFARRRRRQS